jgi:hypothetical protein
VDVRGEAQIQQLIDRQAILDCLLRYTRGVDRLDLDLVRSAFHPDGVDCHGPVSAGADGFLQWWLPLQEAREATQHFITNHTVEIDGDTAHSEAYYTAAVKLIASDQTQLFAGRYVDRLERRDGEWRIAVRIVLPEWGASLDSSRMAAVFDRQHRGSRGAGDPSYERPLRPRPSIPAEPQRPDGR